MVQTQAVWIRKHNSHHYAILPHKNHTSMQNGLLQIKFLKMDFSSTLSTQLWILMPFPTKGIQDPWRNG